jgi:integrase
MIISPSRNIRSHCKSAKMPAKDNRKDRMLIEDEIHIFWDRLTTASMSEPTLLCLKLQLVTAQRKGELIIPEWGEFDLNNSWWTIPSEKAHGDLSAW